MKSIPAWTLVMVAILFALMTMANCRSSVKGDIVKCTDGSGTYSEMWEEGGVMLCREK